MFVVGRLFGDHLQTFLRLFRLETCLEKYYPRRPNSCTTTNNHDHGALFQITHHMVHHFCAIRNSFDSDSFSFTLLYMIGKSN